jgi:hypothetical protein
MMTRDAMSPRARRFGPIALLPLALAAACDRLPRGDGAGSASRDGDGLATGTAAAYSTASTASVAGGLAIGEGNPDQGFLRRMVAQQESLTFAIDRLLPELQSPVALAQAYTIRDRTAIEYQESVSLLRDWFAESHDADRVPRSDGELKTPRYRERMRQVSGALARDPQAVSTEATQLQGGTRAGASAAARAGAPGASVRSYADRTVSAAEAQGWAQDAARGPAGDGGTVTGSPGADLGYAGGASPSTARIGQNGGRPPSNGMGQGGTSPVAAGQGDMVAQGDARAMGAANGGMGGTPGMVAVAASPEEALRALLIDHHRRTLALTEAYWPHMVQAQPRALAVAQHRQSRLELQALLARDSTGAVAPSGQDPRVPISGVPNAGLDDGQKSANRVTVPQSAQSPNAPAPAPPGATPARSPMSGAPTSRTP